MRCVTVHAARAPHRSQACPVSCHLLRLLTHTHDIALLWCAARSFEAQYADPRDRQLLGLASPALDRERMVYVLTLGVAEASPHQPGCCC